MDGEWRDHDGRGGQKASTVLVGSIFQGEVYFERSDKGGFWYASLNGQKLAGYPTMERAKARVDFEIWNRIRLAVSPYKRVLARRASWEGIGDS